MARLSVAVVAKAGVLVMLSSRPAPQSHTGVAGTREFRRRSVENVWSYTRCVRVRPTWICSWPIPPSSTGNDAFGCVRWSRSQLAGGFCPGGGERKVCEIFLLFSERSEVVYLCTSVPVPVQTMQERRCRDCCELGQETYRSHTFGRHAAGLDLVSCSTSRAEVW